MAKNLEQLLCTTAESKMNVWRGNFDAHLDKLASELDFADEAAVVYHRVFRNFERRDASRWYDPYHILFSTGFALRLAQALRASVDRIGLIVPATLLHDVGYYAVRDKSGLIGKKARTIHMQEGAARSARILWECCESLTAEDVEDIIGMVATHDNPYIDTAYVETSIRPYPLRQALRDCDRVWVMHALSFYKDWCHEQARSPVRYESIEDFLAARTVQFYGTRIPTTLKRHIRQPLETLVRENETEIEIPHFDLTKKYVAKLIKRRWKEIAYIEKQSPGDVYAGFKNQPDYLKALIDGDFDLTSAAPARQGRGSILRRLLSRS